jgi:hypothetical protein
MGRIDNVRFLRGEPDHSEIQANRNPTFLRTLLPEKFVRTLYGRATVERKATPRPAQEGLQAGMPSPEIEPDREARRDQARAPFLNKVSPGAGFLADG